MDNVTRFPSLQVVEPLPDPLGLYFRVGRYDRASLADFLAAGNGGFSGVVIEASHLPRYRELQEDLHKRGMDVVLDPLTQQSATLGAYNDSLGELPWGAGRRHSPADFQGPQGLKLITTLAEFVIANGFTQVLAPTHYITHGSDRWLQIDLASTHQLRTQLDRRGGERVEIIYSLALPYSVLRDRSQLSSIVDLTSSAPVSAIWLKVDNLGRQSSAAAILNYLLAVSLFHERGIPLVGDMIGGMAALSLLAFGAVGGLCHGIAMRERFDTSHWKKPRGDSGFSPTHQVYVPSVDVMLKRSVVEEVVSASPSARAVLGCADTDCCQRGVRDMIESPAKHFLYQRTKEVTEISSFPVPLRPHRFLDRKLRPSSDRAVRATKVNWEQKEMGEYMLKNRLRLDSLRVGLYTRLERGPIYTKSQVPLRRVQRD